MRVSVRVGVRVRVRVRARDSVGSGGSVVSGGKTSGCREHEVPATKKPTGDYELTKKPHRFQRESRKKTQFTKKPDSPSGTKALLRVRGEPGFFRGESGFFREYSPEV